MFAAEGTPFTRRIARKIDFTQSRFQQNYHYGIADPRAQRVYAMLKEWHKSHSVLFDWAIDSIAAPKVLSDEGYRSIYKICNELIRSDLLVFKRVLERVAEESANTDNEFIKAVIFEHSHLYACLWSKVQSHYDQYELVYDGVPNPFLD
jgi:hypothetical protein